MGYKEDALDFLGITKWHKAGYTGKGIKIMSDEKVCEKKHSDVISPKGFKSKSGHGDDVMAHIKLVIPDAEHIAFTFAGTFGSNSYKSECAEYIKENKVHIFTTSNLSAFTNQGQDMAMQDCIDKGCIFFSACGNDGKKGVHGESKSDKYWAIGGIRPRFTGNYDKEDEPLYDWSDMYKVSYSSEGVELDYVTIAEILGASGTSFCAPVFAGMIGLVQQFFIEAIGRRLTRTEMELFIKDNLKDVEEEGFDNLTGHGLFILPEPETIKISDYAKDINVPTINEGIYYGGFPQVEDIMIKQMLLTPSEYTRPQTKIKPTAIAWHYVGNPSTTAIANRNYFESLKDTHKTKASSHYIIGLEGEIIQCIPDLEKSFCTNDANDYTISVECCHPDNTGRFTDETYRSMVWLGKYLMQKYSIKNNIRHYDVTGKACPKWFVDNPDEWEKFKKELEGDNMEEVSEWAKTAWNWCKERGYLDGTNPKGTVTREMLAQVLFNLFGKGEAK